VLQGEREMAGDNWTLGRFSLEGIDPQPAGIPRIGVQFTIDADGILHVLARDTATGKEKVVRMKAAVDISDADVEQMVQEAVAHARADVQKRQLVEAQLSADEMLRATAKALERYGDKLSSEERKRIDAAWKGVKEAVDADDLNGLKEAKQVLDEATQKLADIMFAEAVKERAASKGPTS